MSLGGPAINEMALSGVVDRSVGSLIENAPHMAVTFRAAVALGHFRAFFVSGACSHPG